MPVRIRRQPTVRNVSFLVAVVGSGPFPLDMLRYDSCVPHDEHDSTEAAADLGRRAVVLRCYSPSGTVTPGRWASFGWRVLDVVFPGNVCGVDERCEVVTAIAHGRYL